METLTSPKRTFNSRPRGQYRRSDLRALAQLSPGTPGQVADVVSMVPALGSLMLSLRVDVPGQPGRVG